MQKSNPQLIQYLPDVITNLCFFVLAFLAVYFFQERLIADSGYYIFQVINNKSFWIEHQRLVLAFSQWLPLIGVKIGLNLKTILILYSLNHVLFFYLIFLISRYVFKNTYSGLLILLIQTLGIATGFFVPMFELYYCAGFSVLFAAMLHSKKTWYVVLLMNLILLIIFTGHPMAVIFVLLIISIHAFENRMKDFKLYLMFFILYAIILIYKKYNISEYELGKTQAILNNFKHNKYDWDYVFSLIKFLFSQYYIMVALFCIAIVNLIMSKKTIHLSIVVLLFILSLVLINLSLYGFEVSRYQEQVYFPLSFIVSYALIHHLKEVKRKAILQIFLFIIALSLTLGIQKIWNRNDFFSKRVNEMSQYIKIASGNNHSKFFIDENLLQYDPNWSYAIETMLFSSMKSAHKTISICTQEDYFYNQNNEKIKVGEFLFRRWEIYSLEILNKNYFNLDSGNYQLINKRME